MKYPVEQIRNFCEKVWVKAGLSEENARVCVDVLLAADLRGQRTHGTTHMKDYCDRSSKARHQRRRYGHQLTSPTSYVVDAKHAVGMVAAPIMMQKCIEQAGISGACFASVHNGCHYGLGAYYPMMAMKRI